jgi:hypothetical protein
VSTADERVLDVQFTDDTISVNLRDGRVITIPLVRYPRLLEPTPSQRKNWKIAGGGYGIHWPDIDEDLSTEGLLRGAPAPKAWVSSDGKPVSSWRAPVSALRNLGPHSVKRRPQTSWRDSLAAAEP